MTRAGSHGFRGHQDQPASRPRETPVAGPAGDCPAGPQRCSNTSSFNTALGLIALQQRQAGAYSNAATPSPGDNATFERHDMEAWEPTGAAKVRKTSSPDFQTTTGTKLSAGC